MIQDRITQCYYSRMRLYKDRPDILVPGRWHWCVPDAVVLPFPHAFGSFTLQQGEVRDTPLIGEEPLKRGRSKGNSSPRYIGRNWCGGVDLWQNGSLYSQRGTPAVDQEGVPVCCESGPPIPGGVELDGLSGFADGGDAGYEFADGAMLDLLQAIEYGDGSQTVEIENLEGIEYGDGEERAFSEDITGIEYGDGGMPDPLEGIEYGDGEERAFSEDITGIEYGDGEERAFSEDITGIEYGDGEQTIEVSNIDGIEYGDGDEAIPFP